MGMCLLCQDRVPDIDLLEHLRIVHPQEYGSGLARWPDGHLAVLDSTLEPVDFEEPDFEEPDFEEPDARRDDRRCPSLWRRRRRLGRGRD